MSEEKNIVERLRSPDAWNDPAVCGEAADVIDALLADKWRLENRNKSLDEQCMKMHAERDAAREDAERYRWIEKNARTGNPHMDGKWEWRLPLLQGRHETLDACIDAARAALAAKEAK